MMMIVDLLGYTDLSEVEQKYQPDNGCGKECANYLRITHKGETLGIYSDAMEPEDVKFYRDLDWVGRVIEDAYLLGKSDG